MFQYNSHFIAHLNTFVAQTSILYWFIGFTCYPWELTETADKFKSGLNNFLSFFYIPLWRHCKNNQKDIDTDSKSAYNLSYEITKLLRVIREYYYWESKYC